MACDNVQVEGVELIRCVNGCVTSVCNGPGVKTLGFQLKDGSSILLGNRVGLH